MPTQSTSDSDSSIFEDVAQIVDCQAAMPIIDYLKEDASRQNLDRLRRDTLWLMDNIFPTGFVYTVNRGPSEAVHGGFMKGQAA